MKRLVIVATIVTLCAAGAYAANTYAAGNGPSMIGLGQGWTPQVANEMWHKPQGAVLMPAAFFAALRDARGVKMDSAATLHGYGFIADSKSKMNPYGWPVGFTVDDGTRNQGVPQFGFTCTACHTTHLEYQGKTMLVEGGGGNGKLLPFVGAIKGELVATYRDPARRATFTKEAVAYGYPQARISTDMTSLVNDFVKAAVVGDPVNKSSTPSGPGTVDALSGIVFNVMVKALDVPSNARRAVAPVNFPQIWDIWHFNWVQYNASVHQPMDRNVGEAIGLGAQLHITDANGNLNPLPKRWTSTVRIRNLYWMEQQVEQLKPPTWPAGIFGAVDAAKAERGRVLFAANCSRCHGISKIDGGDVWAVHTIPLTKIGTDPNEATAFAKATYDASKLGLSKTMNGPTGLAAIVENVKHEGYNVEGIPQSQWPTFDGFGRKSIIVAPCGYKARPLIGIWATAPFLHNGTVPSVYDMLSETRPANPILGNPEFDPIKLGMVQQSTPDTMTIDLTQAGNSNQGHWWTDDLTRKGRIGPALTEDQKYAIIEYLKIADYANYPTKSVSAPYPLPCADNLHWADNAALNLMP